MHKTRVSLLLNLAHALDHMFLLIFATAVSSIAADMGMTRWEDLMPYGAAAFFFFGVGSLPAGKLGDQWGRRPMMMVFFIGIGVSSLLVSQAQTPMQLALLLAVMGCFASIYHPVGIPMLMQYTDRPGRAIGFNGLMGNLGIAFAAVLTGWLVTTSGWRAAFWLPGLLSIAIGLVFWTLSRGDDIAPAKKPGTETTAPHPEHATLFFVMTLAATTGSLLFNFSTNSNGEVLANRLGGVIDDPAAIGLLLAALYVLASLSQLIIGYLLDRVPLKKLYLAVLSLQLLALMAATQSEGWWFYLVQVLFMCLIFAAIPFTDAMIVKYVDDSMRSRISGVRFAVSFGASSLAVWLIGPIIKAGGMQVFLWTMVITSATTLAVISFLPTAEATPSESWSLGGLRARNERFRNPRRRHQLPLDHGADINERQRPAKADDAR